MTASFRGLENLVEIPYDEGGKVCVTPKINNFLPYNCPAIYMTRVIYVDDHAP